MDSSLPSSSVHGIFQARRIETLKDKFKINSELKENCGIVYIILQRYQMAKREIEL